MLGFGHDGGLKFSTSEGQNIEGIKNIMFNARVVRGNTYASRVETESDRRKQYILERNRSDRQDRIKRERRRISSLKVIEGVDAVDGREHASIQANEGIVWEALPNYATTMDMKTQTIDDKMRPLSPLFIPAKVGIDKAVQVYHQHTKISNST